MIEPAILGAEAFAAITAVEGLQLPPEMGARIDELRHQGMTNDEIRAALFADFAGRDAA